MGPCSVFFHPAGFFPLSNRQGDSFLHFHLERFSPIVPRARELVSRATFFSRRCAPTVTVRTPIYLQMRSEQNVQGTTPLRQVS